MILQVGKLRTKDSQTVSQGTRPELSPLSSSSVHSLLPTKKMLSKCMAPYFSLLKNKILGGRDKNIVVIVQSFIPVWLFITPWTSACQASLSFTISWSLLKLIFIESGMPSSHLVLCHPLVLLPSIFPSIRVFSNELALRIRWPKY